MALLFEGKTTCFLCNKTIERSEDATAFPPFIANKHDPLMVFNDVVVHSICLEKHSKAKILHDLMAADEKRDRLTCKICNKQIETPDEYIGIGCLSSYIESLSIYNFTQYHRHCFEGSDVQDKIRHEIAILREKGEWDSIAEF